MSFRWVLIHMFAAFAALVCMGLILLDERHRALALPAAAVGLLNCALARRGLDGLEPDNEE